MPTFVQVFSSQFKTGHDKEETKGINEIMRKLQEKGAKILDVKVSNTAVGQPSLGHFSVQQFPLYIITYEAEVPIEIEK
jgi:hypothetical protein